MNFAAALKAEISRIASKELRAKTEAMRKVAVGHRREIAVLKKRVRILERQAKSANKKAAPADRSGEGAGRHLRFSANRLATQRKKLGLSAANFAALLGVSPLSIYKWESGKTRPRRAQLESIAAARNIGKREAMARLQLVD
jgi:DNA-binding transcriptional regulator YiaG